MSAACCTATMFTGVTQERRKKEREVEEKRLAAERAAEDERRKAVEVNHITALKYGALCYVIRTSCFSLYGTCVC